MAVGAEGREGSKGLWVLALTMVGAGAGALVRYPQLTAATGLAFLGLFLVGLVVLGAPLLLAEAALGQFRRRNVVDAFGPDGWRFAGGFLAAAALLTAAGLAVVAGWSGRYVIDSFSGSFFDDPDRHFRLLSAGWDAMLGALAAIAVATVAGLAGATRGLRGTVVAVAVFVLLAVSGLAAWAAFQPGAADGRDAFLAADLDTLRSIDGAMVVQAAQQALLPTLVGLGVVATFSGHVHDRTLPRDTVVLVLLLVLLPLATGLFLASLASANGQELAADGSDGLFTAIPQLFASLGEQEGGVLMGVFFGAVLAASLVAILGLLEVAATWLNERYEGWTPKRAFLAVGLTAYLLAIPFSFDADAIGHLHVILVGLVVPVGGLLTAIHIGWIRSQVLDGFRVGDAGHQLDRLLRPLLRFVLPAALLFLLLVGLLQVLDDLGIASRGDAGLWSIVP